MINNSIKYRHSRRVAHIQIRGFQKNNNIIIKVEDNGIGFNVDVHRSDLFIMYKRYHERIPGNGLGLYLSKLRGERLNGEISIKSNTTIGTTVTIELPCHESTTVASM